MKYLICPLCSQSLSESSQGLACNNRHQFDRAKEGYFNLLPVQYKNSREPGDAKQQLIARREFLAADYFLPLANKLKEIINPSAASLLDVGCGEGYFTRLLGEHCRNACVYGIDIAKAGVRMAAKNSLPNISYAVASSHLLPIADLSMDFVIRIYAPSKDEELFRVIKPGGKLIIVTPGDLHLLALRKRIYETIRPHSKHNTPQGFEEVGQYSVAFPLVVPGGALCASLLEMTPFVWKLNEQLFDDVVLTGLSDQADFQLSVYEKMDGLGVESLL